jgi:hypothetical protein
MNRSLPLFAAPWRDFDKEREVVRLAAMPGKIVVRASY